MFMANKEGSCNNSKTILINNSILCPWLENVLVENFPTTANIQRFSYGMEQRAIFREAVS